MLNSWIINCHIMWWRNIAITPSYLPLHYTRAHAFPRESQLFSINYS